MNGTEWITPIYDRTSSDVFHAEDNPQEVSKGAYNYEDLNRIENNTRFVADEMLRRGITPEYITLNSKYNWVNTDIPTRDDMNRIINNVLLLQALSNPEILPELDTIQTGGQMTWMLANAIEKNLLIMKDQPLPAPDTYYLEVVNGAGSGYYTEDTVVDIEGIPYGEQASFMEFERWTGDAEDLKQIADVYSQKTTFTMWHKDAKITAEFKIRIPRKLKIIDGFILDGSNDTERTCFPGDVLNIQANKAPVNMVFHHWELNDDNLKNNITAPMASTTSISMPDADLTMTAFYIYPNVHKLTVNKGEGSGWYEYGERVSIYATPPTEKDAFSYWSGDTSYISGSVNSSFATVIMPDKNIALTANYTYAYSYCDVTVVNGSGGGTSLREGSRIQIVGDQAPDGKIFSHWELVGPGSIANETAQSTNFTVGDGDAIITAYYAEAHTITVINENNRGDISIYVYPSGISATISTNKYVGNQTFQHWEENGEIVSTNERYKINIEDTDRIFTAIYADRRKYTLTVVNGTGSGEYYENTSTKVTAIIPEGYRFIDWSTDPFLYIPFDTRTTVTITLGSFNVTATANLMKLYTLTVINGTGSGQYVSGEMVIISANEPPEGMTFSNWTVESGDVGFFTTNILIIRESDVTIKANYVDSIYYDLTVNGGTGSGQYLKGTSIEIVANPAPDSHKFLNWSGDVENNELSNALASTTNVVSISKNMVVTANYYIPEEVDDYELTVINGTGSGLHRGGEQVEIRANYPPRGYEFWKWIGDISTIIDKYSSDTVLIMPLYPITITAKYKLEGSVDLYTLTVNYGKCEISEDRWESTGDFELNTQVNIIADTPPNGFRFNEWVGDIETVNDVSNPETFVIIQNIKDLVITATFIEMEKYDLIVTDGYGTNSYYENTRVEIVFNKVSTDDEHYQFKQWLGDIEYLDDPTKETTMLTMPAKDISIYADYDTSYHLEVVNGSGEGYYLPNTEVEITANIPPDETQEFSRWTGDVSILSKQFNPNTIATIPESAARIVANYRTKGEENGVGFTTLTLDKISDINNSDINIISGTLNNGFLLTDAKGHIYCCSIVGDTTSSFTRLTKISKGGNIYE